MPAAATAIIQFVGLIVFSKQLAGDGQLRALIPRIPAPIAVRAIPGRILTAEEAMAATGVEEHWGFIEIKAADYISSKNWPPIGMETREGTLYVRLEGERVSFGNTATTARASVGEPARQPVPPRFERVSTLALTHLQPCCENPKLRPEYMAPGFRLASVIDLSTARVRTCANGESSTARRDIVAEIDNDGVLLITATKGGTKRELRLQGGAKLAIEHLPPDEITGIQTHGHVLSPLHLEAYKALIDPTQTCVKIANCDPNAPDASPCTPIFQTNGQVSREGVATGSTPVNPTNGSSDPQARFDFACSNTQWP